MIEEIPGSLRFGTFARAPSENPPEPPFVKGGLGGFRQIVGCFDVVGSFSLEVLIANSVSWANVKVHVRLNRQLVTQ